MHSRYAASARLHLSVALGIGAGWGPLREILPEVSLAALIPPAPPGCLRNATPADRRAYSGPSAGRAHTTRRRTLTDAAARYVTRCAGLRLDLRTRYPRVLRSALLCTPLHYAAASSAVFFSYYIPSTPP